MAKSNDLMVFDRKLRLKVDFKARMSDVDDQTQIFRKPHFSFEGEKMIWFKGKYSISLIDLRDLSQIEYKNLIPKKQKYEGIPEPRFSVADFKGEKILIYYEIENHGMFLYQEDKTDPKIYSCFEKYSFFNKIEALDLQKSKNFGVCAGSNNQGFAFVQAFNFDNSLGAAASQIFENLDCHKINSLAFSQKKEDLIFASTDGPFLVLGLDLAGGKFDLLKIIDIQVNSKIIFLFFRFLC